MPTKPLADQRGRCIAKAPHQRRSSREPRHLQPAPAHGDQRSGGERQQQQALFHLALAALNKQITIAAPLFGNIQRRIYKDAKRSRTQACRQPVIGQDLQDRRDHEGNAVQHFAEQLPRHTNHVIEHNQHGRSHKNHQYELTEAAQRIHHQRAAKYRLPVMDQQHGCTEHRQHRAGAQTHRAVLHTVGELRRGCGSRRRHHHAQQQNVHPLRNNRRMNNDMADRCNQRGERHDQR